MLILDKDPKEIKNRYILPPGIYGGGLKTIVRDDNGRRMVKEADAFQEGIISALSHAHDVDIDELSLCIADEIYPGKYREIKKAISEFLQKKSGVKK